MTFIKNVCLWGMNKIPFTIDSCKPAGSMCKEYYFANSYQCDNMFMHSIELLMHVFVSQNKTYVIIHTYYVAKDCHLVILDWSSWDF